MADEAPSNADTCNSAPSRILFASCTSQHHPQPLWPAIIHRNATAFVWAGDAVYADDRVRWEGPRRIIEDATPDYLRTLYQKQKLHPGYKALLDTNISIFGTLVRTKLEGRKLKYSSLFFLQIALPSFFLCRLDECV
jgi:hypothetical protein